MNSLEDGQSLTFRQIIRWGTFNKLEFILKSLDLYEHPMAAWISVITGMPRNTSVPLLCWIHFRQSMNYNCTFYNFSTLKWHKWVNSLLAELLGRSVIGLQTNYQMAYFQQIWIQSEKFRLTWTPYGSIDLSDDVLWQQSYHFNQY